MSGSAPPLVWGISARKPRKLFRHFRRRNTIGTAGSAKRPASHCRALIRKSSPSRPARPSPAGKSLRLNWPRSSLRRGGAFWTSIKKCAASLMKIKRGKIPLSPVTVSPVACQMCGRAGLLPFHGCRSFDLGHGFFVLAGGHFHGITGFQILQFAFLTVKRNDGGGRNRMAVLFSQGILHGELAIGCLHDRAFMHLVGGQTRLTDKQDQSQSRHTECKSPMHHNETPLRLFMVFLGKKHSHPSVDASGGDSALFQTSSQWQ